MSYQRGLLIISLFFSIFAPVIINMNMTIDIYQTLGIAVGALLLGEWLRKKIKLFTRFCIPAPVVGGLLVSLFTLVCHNTGSLTFEFDDTLKNVCMVFFFTSVGFQANLKVIKKGGKPLMILLSLVILLIILQNALAIGLGTLVGIDSMTAMTAGSIPMIGGHGTAGAFGPLLEEIGISGATTIATAAATFGLVGGSLIGGPLAERLIHKFHLSGITHTGPVSDVNIAMPVSDEKPQPRTVTHTLASYNKAIFTMTIAVALGTVVSKALSATGMTFPIYIGAMIVAAIMRNIGEKWENLSVPMHEINDFGGICLSLFLGIAMVTLKLWELADLALPLVVMLTGQLLLMLLYARFVIFNLMGRDYDAAVLTAGSCGFGMGATPNAMANMQAVCSRYHYSVQAFLLIPIVGSMFVDFLNSMAVTTLINIIK